jgi:tripartite-type tricarboxylate transporter receptor subunit TctC
MKKFLAIIVITLAWFIYFYFAAGTRLVHAQAPYHQGKTITIVVGTLAGDLYDLYARAIALYMGRYIPGNPNIIVPPITSITSPNPMV